MAWRWWGLLFVISSFGYGPENWDSVYEEFRAELYIIVAPVVQW